jgi:L,D-peptidoglycan transpeptidase YkuD (ErfK/YbiS/YcfS/YnhG family)
MEIEVSSHGTLSWRGRRVRCALGRGGMRRDKREGDGATPIGRFALRRVFYRPDRIAPPATRLPVTPVEENMGWCDDPAHSAYNQLVFLPFPGSHERLWRDDALYDLLAVIGWNDEPVAPGLGSAIFLHVASPDFAPTEGCVSVALDDLWALLAACGPGDCIRITP